MFKENVDLISSFLKYGTILVVLGFIVGLIMVAFNT